jgi:hypothetical protein
MTFVGAVAELWQIERVISEPRLLLCARKCRIVANSLRAPRISAESMASAHPPLLWGWVGVEGRVDRGDYRLTGTLRPSPGEALGAAAAAEAIGQGRSPTSRRKAGGREPLYARLVRGVRQRGRAT